MDPITLKNLNDQCERLNEQAKGKITFAIRNASGYDLPFRLTCLKANRECPRDILYAKGKKELHNMINGYIQIAFQMKYA